MCARCNDSQKLHKSHAYSHVNIQYECTCRSLRKNVPRSSTELLARCLYGANLEVPAGDLYDSTRVRVWADNFTTEPTHESF